MKVEAFPKLLLKHRGFQIQYLNFRAICALIEHVRDRCMNSTNPEAVESAHVGFNLLSIQLGTFIP